MTSESRSDQVSFCKRDPFESPPRQIHLSITVEQRAAAERIAGRRTPTTWQQIAREALTAGLAAMEDPPQV